MNFIYKCLLQHALSIVPGGSSINYLLQRYVTHNFPLSLHGFSERVKSTKSFYDWYKKYSLVTPAESLCFEFSSGVHLQNPIGLSLLGFKYIVTADVARIARSYLIDDVITRYKSLADYTVPDPIPRLDNRNIQNILKTVFRIDYIAPIRIFDIALPSNSVDLINSRTTFEHIPREDIPAIIKHCYHLMKKAGVAIISIDYRDHWSFFDSKISIYNFLKYPEKIWKRYNPPIHHQNRLRHVDYLSLFQMQGFQIVEDLKQLPDAHENNQFSQIEIDHHFIQNYNESDLKVSRGIFVLKK